MPVDNKKPKRLFVPPVIKFLVRGYIIIGFILGLEYVGVVHDLGMVIFLISIISISMVFGVGYLLIMKTRPVRASSFDIPNTVLFFAKGGLIIYFVSLLAQFRILPVHITSYMIIIITTVLMLVGAGSYVYEMFQRSKPLPRPKSIRVPRSR